MGILMDLYPQIEAETRQQRHLDDVLTYLGCKQRHCELESSHNVATMSMLLSHNGQTRKFSRMHTTVVPGLPDEVIGWIFEQHAEMEVRREIERQAAIDADGWLAHAEMVNLNG